MPPVFPTATSAYAAVLAGIAIGSAELLRPGLIVPGVSGGIIAMLGFASLSCYSIEPKALLLILAGAALVASDAAWDLRGSAAVVGAIAASLGARCLVGTKIAWPVAAGMSIPFLLATWWLLGMAVRARLAKASI